MTIPATIEDWTALVESGEPFTYANIGGDGEMLTITGWTGTNSDGITSTPEKAEALARCLLEHRYTYAGYNPGKEGSPKLKNAERWLRSHGVNVPIKHPSYIEDPEYGQAKVNVRWVHKEVISSANVQGRWNGFLRAMLAKRWLVVGSDATQSDFVWGTLGLATEDYLKVPRALGWDDLDHIERSVRTYIGDHDLVTFSLGYLTKVLIWRLAPDYPDVTMLDLGACLDPYCGIRNRHGYKRDTWPEAMRKNLEGL